MIEIEPTYEEYIDKITFQKIEDMTIEMARTVEVLRIDLRCTWRRTHELFNKIYLANYNIVDGDQEIGRDICCKAQEILMCEDEGW